MPLLGNAEKAELEKLILDRFTEHYDSHGSGALLVEGLRVVVNGNGVVLDGGQAQGAALATVEVRTLFTALCYVTGGTLALPRDSLPALASEATSTVAAQINRIAQDR
ncbi:MAG TPA: hypothetical protein VN782_17625 [Usitatibacter sp.]|nr:hypothetical protein [Usitatibacter sp.]